MELDKMLLTGLPKWPQMRVLGEPISPVQANEIIRRTDTFFTHGYGGNAHEFNKNVRKLANMPPDWHDLPREFRDRTGSMGDWMQNEHRWQDWWGCVSTEYVHNGWVSNAFIFGPSGWCHPTGQIRFSHNVGKWPSAEEVQADWIKLAEAFPFINLHALLMSGESCEEDFILQPIVGFVVKDGHVEAEGPDYPWFEPWGGWNENPADHDLDQLVQTMQMNPRYRECFFGLDQIQHWHDQVVAKKGPFTSETFK